MLISSHAKGAKQHVIGLAVLLSCLCLITPVQADELRKRYPWMQPVPAKEKILATYKRGHPKLLLNKEAIDNDLEENWAVVAEGVQTILRREGYPNPYEALKELTRTNEAITRESIARFIDELNVAESVKAELRKLSPSTYTGISLL